MYRSSSGVSAGGGAAAAAEGGGQLSSSSSSPPPPLAPSRGRSTNVNGGGVPPPATPGLGGGGGGVDNRNNITGSRSVSAYSPTAIAAHTSSTGGGGGGREGAAGVSIRPPSSANTTAGAVTTTTAAAAAAAQSRGAAYLTPSVAAHTAAYTLPAAASSTSYYPNVILAPATGVPCFDPTGAGRGALLLSPQPGGAGGAAAAEAETGGASGGGPAQYFLASSSTSSSTPTYPSSSLPPLLPCMPISSSPLIRVVDGEGLLHQQQQHEQQQQHHHHQRKRQSTDVGWLYGFCFVSLFCLYFCWVALCEGSPSRLSRGINYQGKSCGADGSVKDLPFLYAPLDPREAYPLLLIQDARCVATCPTETDVEIGSTVPVNIRETDIDEHRSSALAVQFLLQSPTYASTLIAGAYCMPLDTDLRGQFYPLLSTTFRQQQLAIGDAAQHACGVVLAYSLLALLAAALYTLLLRLSPGLVVATGAISSIAVAILAAGILFRNAVPTLFSTDKGAMFSLDYIFGLLVGAGLLALAAAAIFFVVAARRALGKAVRTLECAGEVVFDTMQLFVTPLIFSAVTIIWAWIWMRLFAYMISAGTLDRTEVSFGLDRNGDVSVLGLHRRIVWDARFLFFRFFWIAILFFSLELLYAFGRFCLSYAATVWYFSPTEKDGDEERDVGFCPALVALSLATTHHIGSFVLAALLLPLSRPLRALRAAAAAAAAATDLSPFQQQQQQQQDVFYTPYTTASSAYFLQLAASTMQNLLQPFGGIVEQLTPSAFIEMSMSSRPFFSAVATASARLRRSTSPASYLHGVSQMASALCTAAVSLTVGLLCYTTLTGTERYSSLASPNFVSAPLFVSAYVTLIACFVCMHFFAIWEAVADALMYCFLVESTQFNVIDENPLSKVHAPLCLRELLLDELQGNL